MTAKTIKESAYFSDAVALTIQDAADQLSKAIKDLQEADGHMLSKTSIGRLAHQCRLFLKEQDVTNQTPDREVIDYVMENLIHNEEIIDEAIKRLEQVRDRSRNARHLLRNHVGIADAKKMNALFQSGEIKECGFDSFYVWQFENKGARF